MKENLENQFEHKAFEVVCLVTACGGTPALNFIRSLKLSNIPTLIIGIDISKLNIKRTEADVSFVYTITDKEEDFIDFINKLVNRYNIDLVYAQSDQESNIISKYQDKINTKTFISPYYVIDLCHNKYLLQQKWLKNNLPVAQTMMINKRLDISKAFKIYKSPIWIRNIVSPGGGYQSYCANSIKNAFYWITLCKGWGKFCAAEYLSKDSVTWLAIYKNGKLICSQGRKRIEWEFSNRAISGVTGITKVGKICNDKQLEEIGAKAIECLHNNKNEINGVFGVDFTYNKNGLPYLTEINTRFFTTSLFFTKCGLNMPAIYLYAALNKDYSKFIPKNILSEDLYWIRGMDIEPVLVSKFEIGE